MNRRAAVYLRFSSDKQSMTSLEDQLRVCREFIKSQGDVLVDGFIFQDAAVSGASEAGRDGFQALKAAICKNPRPVDQLVVADLSRLTRQVADMALLMRHLKFYEIEIVGVADGLSSAGPNAQMGMVFKSMMNEMFLTDLAKKTREGLVGQALRGYSPGGKTFGYGTKPTIVPGIDNKTNAVAFVIDEQAAVVREMFELAAQGRSVESIVQLLNARGGPCPDPGKRAKRPKGWTYSSARQLLQNPKYTGTWIFNRSHFVKDPESGKRQRRMHGKEQWLVTDRPELAIVSKEVFDKVQEVFGRRSDQYRRSSLGQLAGTKPGSTRATYLLSGIAKCAVCGSAMSIYGGKKSLDGTKVYRAYRCPAASRSGPTLCSNLLTISKDKLEGAVLGHLSEKILNENCVAFFEAEFRPVYDETLKTEGRQRRVAELERAIEQQRASLDRLIDALAAGQSERVASRIAVDERKLNELQGQLEALLTQPTMMVPELATETLQRALTEFKRLLEGEPAEAKEFLKALVGGELRLNPKEVPPDLQKSETRSTWYYEVSGSAFLQSLLIPLRRGEPGGLPDVAGAGLVRHTRKLQSFPAIPGLVIPFKVEVQVRRGVRGRAA